MLLMICPWIHLGILQHGFERIVVVDAFHAFNESISDDDLSIRASLGPTIAVATAGIRHVALSFVDIQQRVHDVCLTLFIEQGDERGRGAIGVPDGVVVIIVRRFAPFGILATFVHWHNQRVVKGCVEHPLVRFGAFYLELAKLLLPALAYLI